jgi:hypothetical protein
MAGKKFEALPYKASDYDPYWRTKEPLPFAVRNSVPISSLDPSMQRYFADADHSEAKAKYLAAVFSPEG